MKRKTPIYITENRAIVEAARSVADRLGLEYTEYGGDWIIELRRGNHVHFIYAFNLDCNHHAAASIASDKAATYDVLMRHGVSAVPHFVIKSVVVEEYSVDPLKELLERHKTAVVKPLHGSKGRSIRKVNGINEAVLYMNGEDETLWAVAPFVDIDYEIRFVVFDGEVRLAYKKIAPVPSHGLNMFNANLGAKTVPLALRDIPKTMLSLAESAAGAVKLNLCAVDVIVGKDGDVSVLEINSGFSLERFALTGDQNRAEVVALYSRVLETVFS